MAEKDHRLERIGERKAIEVISRLLSTSDIPVGIGDDCAALEFGDSYLLITTDMISERTHMPKASARQIGWHVVAINISDIGSKGGTPIGMVTALGLPRGTRLSFLKDLTRGMDACAREFRTTIIGGDTKESAELNLVGTAFGTVRKEDFMSRAGARPGDLVAVTGELGAAAAGLEALRRGLRRPAAIKALLEPWPRVREGISLGHTHAATACMDISDGLSSSLYHISAASGTGFDIDSERIPISAEVGKVGIDTEGPVLHFGGEYELLMTLDPARVDDARAAVEAHGSTLTVIGRATKEKAVTITRDGKRRRLENLGWEHFRPSRKNAHRPSRKRKGKGSRKVKRRRR